MRSLTKLFALTLTSSVLVLAPAAAHASPTAPTAPAASTVTSAPAADSTQARPGCWDW